MGIVVDCPVCGKEKIVINPEYPEEQINICHRCNLFCKRDIIVYGDGNDWYAVANVEEVLTAWRKRYAEIQHEYWLKNDGKPESFYKGVAYKEFYPQSESPCVVCEVKNTENNSRRMISVDGKLYCYECAEKTFGVAGYTLSYSDGSHSIVKVYPWEIAEHPDLEKVLVDIPEYIWTKYAVMNALIRQFEGWANNEDIRLDSIRREMWRNSKEA